MPTEVRDTIIATGINLGEDTLTVYDEAPWTPSLTFGGGATGLTYSNRVGKLTRVGNEITAVCNITIGSNGSSTGAAAIGGLPTAAAGASYNCVVLWSGTGVALVGAIATLADGATSIVLGQLTAASTAGYGSMTEATLIDGATIRFVLKYFVS